MNDPAELRDVFDRAVSLPPADRGPFLARACAHNDGLRREVERLLGADAGGSLLDSGPDSPPLTPSNAATSIDPRMGARTPALAPGTRLGPYEITAAVGAGGMGEVFKARDTRLDRTVALKVLPADLVREPMARLRLEREARAAAALAHPHICMLLDVGRQGDVDFLVMEFLAGETLAARLASGPLLLDQALTLARQIAEALAAAHRAGIVHRDLKPGNVMITREGAKLLDFGLAKRSTGPVVPDETGAGTPITRTGTILGTVQYMAPEQLQGQPADQRTDIFAFGAVLYEMLTGRRAFNGTSDASLIGSILHTEPTRPSALNPLSPPALDELVQGCLEKDPQRRWQSVEEVLERLASIRNEDSSRQVRPSRGLMAHAARHPKAIAATALLCLAASALAWGLWPRAGRVNDAAGRRPSVERNLTRLTFDAGLQMDPTFSPDGRFIAYASDKSGNMDLWVQPVAGGNAVQVTRSPAHDWQPSWSPDGSTIVFRSERDGGGLYLIPALGGTERRLATFGLHPEWARDGQRIRLLSNDSTRASLYVVSKSGDAPTMIMPEFTAQGEWRWITVRPDGQVSFIGVHRDRGFGFYTVSEKGSVVASDLSRLPADLNDMVHNGRQRVHWNESGTSFLLETLANNGVQNLWRVEIDPRTQTWTSVERLTTGSGADLSAARSPDGRRVAFSSQKVFDRIWRFPIDSVKGTLAEGQPLLAESSAFGFDISRDGRMALFTPLRAGSYDMNLWTASLDSGSPLMVAESSAFGRWSPDGRQMAYVRIRPETIDHGTGTSEGIIAVRTEDGPERQVTDWVREHYMPWDWSPDGRYVLGGKGPRLALWNAADGPASTPASVVVQSANGRVGQARYSPDGHWLALEAWIPGGSSQPRVFVTAAHGSPDRALVPVTPSALRASMPRWSADGRRLYFLSSREGDFLDIWAGDIELVRGTPIGKPIRVTQFEAIGFRISSTTGFSMFEIRDRWLFLAMRSTSGNVWLLDNPEQ